MPAATDPGFGVEYYGETLRRHWKLIATAAIVGLLLAALFLVVRPSRTTATADVALAVVSTNPFDATKQPSDPFDATTETQLVMSYPVALAASEAVGSAISPKTIRAGLEVDAVTDAGIVHISYNGTSAEQARRVADVTALAYIDYRAAQARARLASVVAGVDDRREVVLDGLSQIDPETGNWAKRATRIGLLQELEDLSTQRATFSQVDTTGGVVISTAADNDVSLSPNPIIVVAAGLLAGGVIGVILAFSLRAGSRRWGSASDVQRSTHAPVLGRLESTEAIAPETGESLEVLLGVRERILSRLRPGAHVIVVVDHSADGAGGDVPVNLALVLAQSGRSVDLVLPGSELTGAAHLDPRLAATFPASDSDAIAVHVRDRLGAATGDHLLVLGLPAGSPPSTVLAGLRLADGAVLVGTLGVTTAADATRLREAAAEFGAEILGTVLVPQGRVLTPPAVPAAPAPRPAAAKRTPAKRTPRPKAPTAS
ncbi:hypothetical protein EYE40_11605 [Glaciihabitans arcticus]|uniref:Polysaccharide chain length determinant N-terminal domain-containing protein n=1 Tax=Glaciihabitans arcticus TaxID=2668039 RepID=A0A4Q9GWL3_9MICO|nr:hypothetical protein [Glaciihabitans arcticus]TBN57988.1 hypothetical protein EYE40_11605 [Glaciihabitans arcticus]